MTSTLYASRFSTDHVVEETIFILYGPNLILIQVEFLPSEQLL